MDLYRAGRVNTDIEAFAMGVVRNETLAFFPDVELRKITYETLVELVFGPQKESVLQQYPASRGSNLNQFSILTTDWLFECATRLAATAYAQSGIPTYTYHFMHAPVHDPINFNKPACAVRGVHRKRLSS
jgi:hypothetical protein